MSVIADDCKRFLQDDDNSTNFSNSLLHITYLFLVVDNYARIKSLLVEAETAESNVND